MFRQISQKEIEEAVSESSVSRRKAGKQTAAEKKNQNKVALPAGYKLMKEKSSAGGVLEKITRVPARLYTDSSISGMNPVTKQAASLEETLLSDEEKQKKAFKERNYIHQKARDSMLNRAWAEQLQLKEVNKTWEQILTDRKEIYDNNMKAVYQSIINSSQKSRPGVDHMYGL